MNKLKKLLSVTLSFALILTVAVTFSLTNEGNEAYAASKKVTLKVVYVDKYSTQQVGSKTYTLYAGKSKKVKLSFKKSSYKTKVSKYKTFKIKKNTTYKVKVTPKVRKQQLKVVYYNKVTKKVAKVYYKYLPYNKKYKMWLNGGDSHYKDYTKIWKHKYFKLKKNTTYKAGYWMPYQYTLYGYQNDTYHQRNYIYDQAGNTQSSFKVTGYYGETKKVTVPEQYGYTRDTATYNWKVTGSKMVDFGYTPLVKNVTVNLYYRHNKTMTNYALYATAPMTVHYGDYINISQNAKVGSYSYRWYKYSSVKSKLDWDALGTTLNLYDEYKY